MLLYRWLTKRGEADFVSDCIYFREACLTFLYAWESNDNPVPVQPASSVPGPACTQNCRATIDDSLLRRRSVVLNFNKSFPKLNFTVYYSHKSAISAFFVLSSRSFRGFLIFTTLQIANSFLFSMISKLVVIRHLRPEFVICHATSTGRRGRFYFGKNLKITSSPQTSSDRFRTSKQWFV